MVWQQLEFVSPTLPLLFIFCSSDLQRFADPYHLHFYKLLCRKKQPLLGKDVEVFLLVPSMKKFTLQSDPDLTERITQFLASASWHHASSGMGGHGRRRCLPHPDVCTLSSWDLGWGCLGHPLCGECNMCLLIVFGLLSIRAFIVPILLPLQALLLKLTKSL